MIVAIDAGNSRIKWGCHDGITWKERGNVPTDEAERLADVAARWPRTARVVACSVAGPAVETAVQNALGLSGLAVQWVRPEPSAHGVRNGYEQPERLGADRWAALVAARHKVAGPCVVVCSGTATTVDWLDGTGSFRGGLILPGMHLMLTALARGTAQLPHARGVFRDEPRNTMDAIVSGCLHAQAGAIERMYAKAATEEPAVICMLTGGAAHRLAPCLGVPCRVEETLVLDGLLQYASAT
ncbi:type III pantothenate kinase [Propionivibrio sp.]|jgi:type III pantothenate kinase|uniref:type III pantothenate kinase n=1 Tax=Propionivibrio sp. TaxID=2212460 RepID=UPI00272EE825|nr:type III pantothenate kinase [Propionivibrio sp.]